MRVVKSSMEDIGTSVTTRRIEVFRADHTVSIKVHDLTVSKLSQKRAHKLSDVTSM